jgi:Polysaccharide lyase
MKQCLGLLAALFVFAIPAGAASTVTYDPPPEQVTVDLSAREVPCDPPPPPPPPPPSPFPPCSAGAYFCYDYSTQDFRSPWTTLFSYTSPGYVNVYAPTGGAPASQTPDGRVKVVPNPAGAGYVGRFEIRNSDPGWPNNTALSKAELRTIAEQTFNRPGGAQVGDVRWFREQIYLPYTATERFDWASGGSNAFNDFWELHPAASTFATISMNWYGGCVQCNWVIRATRPSPTVNYSLFSLTDSAGNRVMSNHNRWIDILVGVRFAPDSTGWLEAWVDGVNVLPRTFRQTMIAGDSGMYLKHGLYKQEDASYPSGASAIYWGPTQISLTKP